MLKYAQGNLFCFLYIRRFCGKFVPLQPEMPFRTSVSRRNVLNINKIIYKQILKLKQLCLQFHNW